MSTHEIVVRLLRRGSAFHAVFAVDALPQLMEDIMSWGKLDDGYDNHPKIVAITHADGLAAAIHAQAITACSREESDGIIDPFWLQGKVPDAERRKQVVEHLVAFGLFDRLPAGKTVELTDQKGTTVTVGPFDQDRLMVHDYLDFNFSSAHHAGKREVDADRKARQRAAKRAGRAPESDGCPTGTPAGHPMGHQPESERSPKGVPEGVHTVSSGSRIPDTVKSTSTSKPSVGPDRPDAGSRRPKKPPKPVDPEVQRLCDLLADLIRRRDPKTKANPQSDGWRRDMRLLVADRQGDVAEVERVLRWSQADSFWQTNVLSPKKLRAQFEALRGKATAGAGDGAAADDSLLWRNGRERPDYDKAAGLTR